MDTAASDVLLSEAASCRTGLGGKVHRIPLLLGWNDFIQSRSFEDEYQRQWNGRCEAD